MTAKYNKYPATVPSKPGKYKAKIVSKYPGTNSKGYWLVLQYPEDFFKFNGSQTHEIIAWRDCNGL